MRLTDKKYWDSSYNASLSFYDFADHNVSHFLNKHLAEGKGKESLEIGSFPGSFIPTIARKGFRVNGIDFNERNCTDLPEWLRSLQINVGEFYSSDFFEFVKNPPKRYDMVCSFGFIEHFKNYEEVLLHHMSLVKPGGQLIVTAPNFRGLMQLIPHYIVDRPNLAKHFVPSMNPRKWKKILETNGFEVQYAGFFGGYGFWIDQKAPKSTFAYLAQRAVERSISQMKKLFSFLKVEGSAFSCLCGVVATRKSS